MNIADHVLDNKPSKQTKGSPIDLLEKMTASKVKIIENARKDISFSEAILKLDGIGVIFPNTINLIQGKSGVHKSRLVELILSSFLTIEQGIDYLGFSIDPTESYYGIYFDTERNLNAQFPYAVQQIKLLTGYNIENDVPNLDPISMVNISRENRFLSLKVYLEHTRKKLVNGEHLVVILDVVTDCIGNFNDPKQSMELIDLMNDLINEYNLTFLCVIHENPLGNDKARGHLGTELVNKSSTVMQIGFASKESDLIKIVFKKCRNTKQIDPFHLVFSEEQNRLVSATSSQIKEADDSKRGKAKLKDLVLILPDVLKEPLSRSALIETLTKEFKCSPRTIEDRLKLISKQKTEITNKEGARLFLDKFKRERMVYFALKKDNSITATT